MGELKDMADKKGKWLKLNVGETIVAQYMGYKVVPSRFDPSEEAIQYHLKVDNIDKYWTTSSLSVMYQFDEVQIDDVVKISRLPMVNQEGEEIPNKSQYKIVKRYINTPPGEDAGSDDDTPF